MIPKYKVCVLLLVPLITYLYQAQLTPPTTYYSIQLDMSGPEHNFWLENPNPACRNLSTKFAQVGTLPRLSLASYPGSGNTWVRYMVETITGVFTASIRQVC